MAQELKNSLRDSIAVKLLRIVFSLYLSITVLMTLTQMFNEYLLEKNDVKHALQQTQLIFEANLVKALWDFSDEQVHANETGIMQMPAIVGVQIFDEIEKKIVVQKGFALNQQGKIIHSENKKTSAYLQLFAHKFPLIEDKKKIGEVTLYSSNEVVFDKVKYNFLVIIISAIIKTILLWVLFLWAFNRFLIKQLDVFCYALEKVNIDKQKDGFLSLETFETYELSRLEYLFNNMLSRIIESKEKLDILNRTLEEKIDTRTKELKKSNQQLEQANRHLEKYVRLIEKKAITDELTTLYNRRHFNQMFPKEIKRAIRDKQAISFMMIDVDHFKQYNDNYGHQKGDDVLAAIGEILKLNCKRGSDIPLRLGGEEFGIIFSDVNTQQSMAFAENIRKSIEMLKIEHLFSGSSNCITASFGLVTIIKPSMETNMDTLYKLADEALYCAKDNGRNQVKEAKQED